MLRPVAELGEDFRGVLAEPGQVPGPGPADRAGTGSAAGHPPERPGRASAGAVAAGAPPPRRCPAPPRASARPRAAAAATTRTGRLAICRSMTSSSRCLSRRRSSMVANRASASYLQLAQLGQGELAAGTARPLRKPAPACHRQPRDRGRSAIAAVADRPALRGSSRGRSWGRVSSARIRIRRPVLGSAEADDGNLVDGVRENDDTEAAAASAQS